MLEQEILEQLTTIKWLTIAEVSLVAIACVTFLVSAVYRSRELRATSDSRLLSLLEHEALVLDSRGEYQALVEKAEEILEHFPSDLMGHWYYAIGHMKTDRPGSALTAFSRIQQIDPTWMADEIEAYISDIKSTMQGPKRT